MPTFRILGFPVRVRIGFLVFLAVVIVWNPSVGWRFGLAVTVFSLIHELGHAVAARRLGAEPEIALDFLAGTTRYTPPRPITPLERAGVALAGPFIEILIGLAALGVLRVNPLDVPAVFDHTEAAVIWIAGPIFGLLNLLPIYPLDGGHVLAGALEELWPSRGRDFAEFLSTGFTIGFGVLALAVDSIRWLAPFALLLVALQAWLRWGHLIRPVRRRRVAVDGSESGGGSEAETAVQLADESVDRDPDLIGGVAVADRHSTVVE
ncbi:MAG: hypothetical protein RL219_2357 [Actinomycetota bacterium]